MSGTYVSRCFKLPPHDLSSLKHSMAQRRSWLYQSLPRGTASRSAGSEDPFTAKAFHVWQTHMRHTAMDT
eukprot:4098212-Amphidinium_carterae.1